ncbi:MAG: metal ABC transporter permease [Candidatus Aminicenantes bacterium]|nr:metal ABC transporter permease [Candidatus Aminicenantes bacterium]
MNALLTYGFFQRALFAGVFVALACALLGVFLILRKDAMIGHGLAHIMFAGIALGLLLNVLPLIAALIVGIIAAIAIMNLKEKAGVYGDTAIAIMSSIGFASGILIISFSNKFNVDLFGYLFGDILAIDSTEVWLSVALAGSVLFIIILFYRKFMFMTFDRESAKAAGMKVQSLDTLLTILTAVTVVLGMKVVGLLLVSALLVIPSAAGLQLASSFKKAIIFASGVAVFSVILGLIFAFYLDFPASGTIVLLSGVFFLFSIGFKKGSKFF